MTMQATRKSREAQAILTDGSYDPEMSLATSAPRGTTTAKTFVSKGRETLFQNPLASEAAGAKSPSTGCTARGPASAMCAGNSEPAV